MVIWWLFMALFYPYDIIGMFPNKSNTKQIPIQWWFIQTISWCFFLWMCVTTSLIFELDIWSFTKHLGQQEQKNEFDPATYGDIYPQ